MCVVRLHPGVRAALWGALALAGGASASAAQVVQGRVRLVADRAASDVSVILVDSAGGIVAGTLTDSAGRYALRAPADGAYRVRVRRIGFAPDSSPVLRLAAPGTAAFDAALVPRPLTLAAVVVRGTQRCVAPKDAEGLTAGLWQEVQSALDGAIATTASSRVGFTLRRFERQLDAASGTVVRSKTWELRSVSSEGYRSIPAESLAARGFVQAEGRDRIYAAPDARTLTSEAFARTHCLRPTLDPERPALIGLAFEPVGRQRQGDVTGALWIDRAGSELRTIEYWYTGNGPGPRAEGRVEYRRLSNGAWVIGAWVIRVPVVVSMASGVPPIRPRAGKTVEMRDVGGRSMGQEAIAIWELGGDIASLFDPTEAARTTGGWGAVHGRVVESASERGVVGVVVELAQAEGGVAGLRAVTTADGTFAFDSVRTGSYALRATAARFDTLDTEVAPVSVEVKPGSRFSVSVATVSAGARLASLCPAGNPLGGPVALHGTVRDGATGRPLAGARVAVEWLTDTRTTGKGITGTRQGRVAFTDSAGRYLVCGLPSDQQVVIRASSGARQGKPLSLEGSGETIRMRRIDIP
jgi:hypothetical protein